MKHLRVPREIALADLKTKAASWSAGMYRRVEIPTSHTRSIRGLVAGYDKGTDPGSMYYLKKSTHYFIRTKALQAHSYLISPKGGAITGINPRVFEDMTLADGDILLSKDSNVGESAMVDGDGWWNHMLSGGIVRLRPSINRHYLFGFLKHDLFKTELLSKVPRGATIAHANELWLDCRIPFPAQRNSDDVITYVAGLTQVVVDKEKAIRARNDEIRAQIEAELSENQTEKEFQYSHPTLDELRATLRLDTGLYCRGFRAFQHCVNNYRRGATTLSAMGVRSRRGPNLAVSVIGKSLYSETYKPGWYELIRPVNIGEYGTLDSREWLGSPKKLPTVNRGDLILGCEGFEKGRSLVLVDAPERCTTNFHGTVLFWPGAEVWETIFVRCFLAYLREHGVIDWVGVGGSGGHMSPDYFDYLPFPRFPDSVRERIARLYNHTATPPRRKATLASFVAWHREWNEDLGIWELDREMKTLRRTLEEVQEQIIEGKTVKLPFA
jgi:type I restriction enzyme S subunit